MTDDLLEEMDQIPEIERDSAEAAGEKKSFFKRLQGKKKLIIFALAFVGVLAAIAGAWILFFSGPKEGDDLSLDMEPSVVTEKSIQESLEKKDEIVFEDIVVLEPFERIPLKGGSAMGMISLSLSLELSDHRYRKQVYTMEDRIRNIVEGQVREMNWRELRNPEGKIKLKYELLSRMNRLFPKVTIRNIYFTNFLMQ